MQQIIDPYHCIAEKLVAIATSSLLQVAKLFFSLQSTPKQRVVKSVLCYCVIMSLTTNENAYACMKNFTCHLGLSWTIRPTNGITKRSSAIAGRLCDAKACQGLLKWTRKWQPRLKWPSDVLEGHQKWHQSKASVWFPYHTPFLRNLMRNSTMTLIYAQGHWQSYHLKAVVWPCM